LVFDLKAFVCKKSGTRTFPAAARGSGGEQLSPILLNKSGRFLTQASMIKVLDVFVDE
jgi:hypothetical protein